MLEYWNVGFGKLEKWKKFFFLAESIDRELQEMLIFHSSLIPLFLVGISRMVVWKFFIINNL
jgi:hypothetical protein